jgi:Transposase DDE domain
LRLLQISGHDRIFMANITHCNSIIHEEFFKPIFEFFPHAANLRNCPALSDATWIEAGVRRCLGIFQSGRDFLQQIADIRHTEIGVSTFFESLKSSRRLRLLDELLAQSRLCMRRNMPDAFAHIKSLDDFDLYAGDGHFIAAACHDVPASRSGSAANSTTRVTTTKYATGHLYSLDLRSHAMSHLSVADQIERKKEHEMRALKRQTAETLRQGAPTGRKVLYIWDRAGIDFRQWFAWKHGFGIYFLSREKENMNLIVVGNHHFDVQDPVNCGVVADQIVGTCCGASLRRVIYQDPESGIIYHYLTTLPATIPPGVIALLYKSRWDIEKVFDEFKNKLVETKAWASSANAKTIQARMLCLTHNLMTHLEEIIRRRCGVDNQAEFKRRRQRKAAKPATDSSARIAVERFTQRTVKFIRWLKSHLDLQRDWDDAVARLTQIYARM